MAENKWNRLNWSRKDKLAVGMYLEFAIQQRKVPSPEQVRAKIIEELDTYDHAGEAALDRVLQGTWKSDREFREVLRVARDRIGFVYDLNLYVSEESVLRKARAYAKQFPEWKRMAEPDKKVARDGDVPFSKWTADDCEAVGSYLYFLSMRKHVSSHPQWCKAVQRDIGIADITVIFKGELKENARAFRALASKLDIRSGSEKQDGVLLRAAIKHAQLSGGYEESKAKWKERLRTVQTTATGWSETAFADGGYAAPRAGRKVARPVRAAEETQEAPEPVFVPLPPSPPPVSEPVIDAPAVRAEEADVTEAVAPPPPPPPSLPPPPAVPETPPGEKPVLCMARWTPVQRQIAGAWLEHKVDSQPRAFAFKQKIHEALRADTLQDYFSGEWQDDGKFRYVARQVGYTHGSCV